MGSRTVVALSIIPLVLAACGAGATAPSGPASSFGPFDRAQVDNLTAQGLSEGQAIILAMSTISVVSADDHSAHVVEALPTGETADIAIALTPASTGDPSVLTTTAEATPGGFAVTLRYFVPHATSGIPARLALDRAPVGAPGVAPADETGGQVVVRVGIQKGTEQVFDIYVEHLQSYLEAEGKLDPFVQGIKAVGSVFDALDLSAAYKKLSARIDALKKCAENPTNQLTIDAYQKDPGTKDRLLQQVEDTRLEIKANAAAEYVGLLNDTMIDLTKVKWLGVAIGAGVAWVKHDLDALNESAVADLENSIVKCEEKTPAPTEPPQTPPATTVPSTCPPDSTEPGCCADSACQTPGTTHATRIAGTLSWQLRNGNQSVTGSATFSMTSTDDFDFVIEPGGTYVLDVDTDDCGSGHLSGVLIRGNLAGNPPEPKPGQGSVGVVGGPGRDLSMTILLLSDRYTCPDVDPPYETSVDGFAGCPYFANVHGPFEAGPPERYDFDCTTSGEAGTTGSVHGSLTAAQ